MTLSGGDPLYEANRIEVWFLCKEIRERFPDKTIWLYTGYTWERIMQDVVLKSVMEQIDILVDGPFIEEFKDVNYHWAGSTNQRVIDVKQSLLTGHVVLLKED